MPKPAPRRGPSGHASRTIKPTLCVTLDPVLLARVRAFKPEGMSLAFIVGKLLDAGLQKYGPTYNPAKG